MVRIELAVLLRRRESSHGVRTCSCLRRSTLSVTGFFSRTMIDTLSLLISHGLIMLAAWRLLSRPDLDRDPEARPEKPGDA